jgi:hypothetical protein
MTNDVTKMPEPMSKEEMIDTLKGLVFGTFNRTTAKEREALDMAIKALEQQPCEDAVSREAVKEMLTEEWTKYMPMELDINLSFVLDKISTLPSVTPKFMDAEIQKIQEMEQAQLEKAYELGNAEIRLSEDYVSREILDKIKAEIDQEQYYYMATEDYDEGIRLGLMLAYKIINKYIIESEDEK